MAIELIPVIEIEYDNKDVKSPDKYPYWENSEIWDKYNEESNKKAGFKDTLTSYVKGSSLYRLLEITDSNLIKLAVDYTKELREGKYETEQFCSFFGGYVLKVDGEDKYFPQCCGQLSDINYWEKLSLGTNSYYEGHPTPVVQFDDTKIIFDFAVDEFDEQFQPTPPQTILTIDRLELQIAVDGAKKELNIIQTRLESINEKENLNIENIGRLLIWGN